VLRGLAHAVGNPGRTDLARAFPEVFAGVVEGGAGVALDLDRRQGERSIALIDDADGQLAPGDELLRQIRNALVDLKISVAIDEVVSAARDDGDRLQDQEIVYDELLL